MNAVVHAYVNTSADSIPDAPPPPPNDSVALLGFVSDRTGPETLVRNFFNEIKYFSWSGSGPAGRPLHGEPYERERYNPMHEFHSDDGTIHKAIDLCKLYLKEMHDRNEPHTSAAGFELWLNTRDRGEVEAVLQLIEIWKRTDSATLANMENMVKYLNMVDRQRYAIEFDPAGLICCRLPLPGGGPMEFAQVPYDTQNSVAAFGGRDGRAIWVESPSRRFYSSTESKVGKFHHSTFLAGRNVKAAGDWRVEHGVLKTISAMSGHYKPPVQALYEALKDIKASAPQVLNKYAVVENVGNIDGKGGTTMPVQEFLERGEKKPGKPDWLKDLQVA